MQNDSSVRHIAVTCPHCGKHYKKVPYEAIKKYNFAFCKQCNAKFQITAAELEEALLQALNALQPDMQAAQTADSRNAAACSGAAPQGQANESAEAAQDTQPEPSRVEPPATQGFLPDTAQAPQAAARESDSLDQAIEQKITDLAATMEDTFSQPAAFAASDAAGDGTEDVPADAAVAEPTFSITVEAEDDAHALAAREAGSLRIENLPDVTSLADKSFEPPDAFQAVPPSRAGEDIPDQTFLDELNLLTAEKQSVAEPALDDQCPDDFSIVYSEEQPAPDAFPGQPAIQYPAGSAGDGQFADEELLSSILAMDLQAPEAQPSQDAGQDEFMSPELTFLTPGTEKYREELSDASMPETLSPADFAQDAPADDSQVAALLEELLPAGYEDVLPDETEAEITFGDTLTEAVSDMPAFETEPAAEEFPIGDMLLQNTVQESLEEELLDESLIEDMDEPAMEEEPFTEELLDESFEEERSAQNSFYPAASQARGPLSSQSDVSFFDSLQDAEGTRDVSAMLKQLVLPADDIEEGMEQFVLFSLGEQTFAAPIANVVELSLPPELIAVPNTPQWILGVSNMRGEIISVIDFKGFLNIEPDSFKKPARMIIAQTCDRQMVIGLMVDSISGIKYFSVDAIQPLEQQEHGLSDAFFQGACLHESEVVIFLDLEQILQSSKMRQFQ